MKTKNITMIALFVAFISVSAQIAIPLGPVPFTLQPTLVLLTGLLLGGKRGFVAVLIYVLVGAVGIPVFSGFKGGFSVIFAQTGGFIMSFSIMAYIAGEITEITKKEWLKYFGCIIGVVVNFALGAAYFMFITEMTLQATLTYTVYPFIFTTLLQIVIAVNLSNRLKMFTEIN